MKIATWNLERPTRTSKKLSSIVEILKELDPDIVILTETNDVIDLGQAYHSFHTASLPIGFYKEGERRVSVFTKFPFLNFHNTFRNDTSVCVELKTDFGNLIVYGTVIGIYGNRRADFIADLDQQLVDFDNIAAGNNFCLAGDLNMSFGCNTYYTEEGRGKLNDAFERSNLINLTANIPENIDHIVVSKSFLGGTNISPPYVWNPNKDLSDHIGVCVTIS